MNHDTTEERWAGRIAMVIVVTSEIIIGLGILAALVGLIKLVQ